MSDHPEGIANLALGHHRIACSACVSDGHSPRRRNLSVTVKPDATLWHCHRCGWEGGLQDGTAHSRVNAPTRTPLHVQPAPRVDAWAWAERIWSTARPIRGTLAETYLRARLCALPPDDGHLRFVPELRHGPSGRAWPCMVALVTHVITGEPMTLHRTYIAEDGSRKAPIDPPRLLVGGLPKKGGVIRLWPDDCVTTGLAVAEGIETALTAAHAFTPAWACIDAGNLAELPVLPGIESITIIADHDAAGIKAGQACAQRWANAGREAFLWKSQREGHDLNDEVAA